MKNLRSLSIVLLLAPVAAFVAFVLWTLSSMLPA